MITSLFHIRYLAQIFASNLFRFNRIAFGMSILISNFLQFIIRVFGTTAPPVSQAATLSAKVILYDSSSINYDRETWLGQVIRIHVKHCCVSSFYSFKSCFYCLSRMTPSIQLFQNSSGHLRPKSYSDSLTPDTDSQEVITCLITSCDLSDNL